MSSLIQRLSMGQAVAHLLDVQMGQAGDPGQQQAQGDQQEKSGISGDSGHVVFLFL
jgi:hypothetical protein